MMIHIGNGEVYMRKIDLDTNTTKPHIPSFIYYKKILLCIKSDTCGYVVFLFRIRK